MTKPAILISCPVMWSIRNVLRSGLYNRLAEKFRIVLAIPQQGREGLLQEGVAEENIWVPETLHRRSSDRIVRQLLREAHRKRHHTSSDDIFSAWLAPHSGARSVKTRISDLVSKVASQRRVFDALDSLGRSFSKTSFLDQRRIAEEGFIAALSTCCVAEWEASLFCSLKRYGIPTVAHILSFDNLTSRGYLPLHCYDYFLVWQQNMKEELSRFYNVAGDKIKIVGTPQFDFHVQEDHIWTRSRTSSALGINEDQPYFVYCANHKIHTPSEPRLVENIIRHARVYFPNHQWVLRLHPMDDYTRWNNLAKRCPNVCVSLPWKQADMASYWAVPSTDEIALLGNTLRYSSATLAVASTIALDSSVVGTPAICIAFNSEADDRENRYYHDVHFAHHYQPIAASGAVNVVTNMDELKVALQQAVNNRESLSRERAALVKNLCGDVDGGSVGRIVHFIEEIAERKDVARRHEN